MTTLCDCGQQRAKTPRQTWAVEQAETEPIRGANAEAHPTAGALPADIAAHLLRVHHRSLRERLLWIEGLFDKSAAEHSAGPGAWPAIGRKFAALHDELVSCLLQERGVVFAPILHQQRSETTGLHEAIRALGKTHAHLLHQLWALTRQVAEARQVAVEYEAGEAIAAELSDLVDEYCQHLFEEECLLFPQLAAPRAGRSGPAAAAPAALDTAH